MAVPEGATEPGQAPVTSPDASPSAAPGGPAPVDDDEQVRAALGVGESAGPYVPEPVPGADVPGIPLPPEQRRAWRRYVALGDSLSEGLGDPVAGGLTRGWATLLADRLRRDDPSVDYVNLAVRGYMVRHVLRRQLGAALDLQPDLVSIFIGGNDCLLSRAFYADRFAEDLDALVAPFVGRGATVVMSTLPDLTACSLIPPPYRGALRRRLEIANALVRTVSRRHRTVLLDAWADPRTRRHGMWSIDRIHPSADGHRLIAASVMQLLGLPVDETDTSAPTTNPLAVLRRHSDEVRWLVTHGSRRAASPLGGS
jgi:lysophospholipase L1-like esterase